MSEFQRPHYQRAPIAEAVIDFRVARASDISLEAIKKSVDRLKDKFPILFPIHQFSVDFPAVNAVGEHSGEPANSQEHMGWRLTAQDQSRVLQFQRTGFTYSHFPPYSNWEQFSGEARTYWDQFAKDVGVNAVSRVAVRIVNRIPVPKGQVDPKQYLTVYPVVPETLPVVANALFVQLQLSVPSIDESARAIINVASGQDGGAGPHLLLDVDLFVERDFSDPSDIWALLDKLGLQKDIIFESCITDEVRKVIK